MALIERPIIARRPDLIPHVEAFVEDLAGPAGLKDGAALEGSALGAWNHDGDHLCLTIRPGFALLVRPRDEASPAFLRTGHWNISYRADPFDAAAEALLVAVAERLEAATEAAGLDTEALSRRYFTRPDRDDYLEVTPGRKLYIRVTDQCDENCIFCNATEGNANIVSSREALRDLLARLPTDGLEQVIFSGGEPTLLSNLPELVGMAYDRGARQIILQTNGVRLARPGALETYLPWRDRLGIGISLHAADPALSDQMTGAGAVPQVPLAGRHDPRRGGPEASETLPPLPAKPTRRFHDKVTTMDRCVALGFDLKITCVVMRPNLAHLPDLTRWVTGRYGEHLHSFQVSYAAPRGRAWLHAGEMPTFGEYGAAFRAAVDIGRAAKVPIEFSQNCSLPPCLMLDCLECYDIHGDYSGGATAGEEFVKPARRCAGCALDAMCPGVWRRHIEVYGDEEIGAVTDRPPQKLDIDNFAPGEIIKLDP